MELSRARFRGTLTLDAPLDKKKKRKKRNAARRSNPVTGTGDAHHSIRVVKQHFVQP